MPFRLNHRAVDPTGRIASDRTAESSAATGARFARRRQGALVVGAALVLTMAVSPWLIGRGGSPEPAREDGTVLPDAPTVAPLSSDARSSLAAAFSLEQARRRPPEPAAATAPDEAERAALEAAPAPLAALPPEEGIAGSTLAPTPLAALAPDDSLSRSALAVPAPQARPKPDDGSLSGSILAAPAAQAALPADRSGAAGSILAAPAAQISLPPGRGMSAEPTIAAPAPQAALAPEDASAGPMPPAPLASPLPEDVAPAEPAVTASLPAQPAIESSSGETVRAARPQPLPSRQAKRIRATVPAPKVVSPAPAKVQVAETPPRKPAALSPRKPTPEKPAAQSPRNWSLPRALLPTE